MQILGYYENDSKQPIAYLRLDGVVVFNNENKIKKNKKLGGIKELHQILSNVSYYTMNNQKGGGGIFGESYGRCGWGDGPSCCFFDCSPVWKTQVWPFDFSL